MRDIELYSLALDYLRIPLENALGSDGLLADDLPILGGGNEWSDTTRSLREGLEKALEILEFVNARDTKTTEFVQKVTEKMCA